MRGHWMWMTRCHVTNFPKMSSDLEKKVREAIAAPKNMGELPDADRMGTVGNSDCGEMLRLWVKFKEEHGQKVIDKASFQSFGCETAIAVASMATELIRGKTPDEALAMRHDELTGELGALPPMKIHCAQLVEGALKSALKPEITNPPHHTETGNVPSLMDSLTQQDSKPTEGRLRLLKKKK